MKKRHPVLSIAYGLMILILVLVILYSGLQLLESTVFSSEVVQTESPVSKTITKDGIDYFPRQDLTVLLITGIDRSGPMEPSGSYRNTDNADMITLAVFDQTHHETRLLTLNRDTMLDMPMIGIGGRPAGTAYGQLALSHSYGTGMIDSSENVRKTVSDFLHGIHIDQYITATMDAVAILNDAVGGVTVNVTDDFSSVDPSIHMGQMTLHGPQAASFVRSRGGVGNQLNLSRMERQKEYMAGFMESLHRAYKTDPSVIFSAYDKVNEYMITDCSTTVMSNYVDKYGDYPIVEVLSPEGENKLADYPDGSKHYEFYVDQESLDDLILRLFYAPKK